jgi:hypothetical protein
MPPVLFFLLNIALATQAVLWFHNFQSINTGHISTFPLQFFSSIYDNFHYRNHSPHWPNSFTGVFETIGNKIVFLIFISDNSLLEYSNVTDYSFLHVAFVSCNFIKFIY